MTSSRSAVTPPAATDPAAEVGPAFKAAMAAVRRLRGRERRHPGELRDAQYSLLFSLCHGEAAQLPSSELAHLADLSPASATELLDELEAAGLVERERSAADRRVVLVSLTQQGLQAVRERRERMEPRWRAMLQDFSAEELGAAVAVLHRLREFFEELGAER